MMRDALSLSLSFISIHTHTHTHTTTLTHIHSLTHSPAIGGIMFDERADMDDALINCDIYMYTSGGHRRIQHN